MIQLMYPVKAIIFMILLEMHVLNIMKSYFPMSLLIKTNFLKCNAQSYIDWFLRFCYRE